MEPPKKVVLGLDPNLDPKHKNKETRYNNRTTKKNSKLQVARSRHERNKQNNPYTSYRRIEPRRPRQCRRS